MALVENKKAYFNYEIIEKIEAGIELLGLEVKSLRKGQANLEGSHVVVRGGEAYATGITIAPYQMANTPESYEPTRNRRLLLTKKQLHDLSEIEKQKGLTIVPLSVYNKGRKLKLELGIARGKKAHDKRESIKKRDTEREIRREYK